MKTTVKLPICGITIDLNNRGGSIYSDLHENDASDEYNAAMDALESIILAHACAGINVQSPAYLEGIETAIETCTNNMG